MYLSTSRTHSPVYSVSKSPQLFFPLTLSMNPRISLLKPLKSPIGRSFQVTKANVTSNGTKGHHAWWDEHSTNFCSKCICQMKQPQTKFYTITSSYYSKMSRLKINETWIHMGLRDTSRSGSRSLWYNKYHNKAEWCIFSGSPVPIKVMFTLCYSSTKYEIALFKKQCTNWH